MSATLLANELSTLISEAKRKQTELRHAAEKSLQELKSLSVTSENQLAADLSRRPEFIEPFLIACGTRTPKLAGSGVTCLQRLVISKGLPKSRLGEAVEAFQACTDLGLDVQLKVLQALPSLVQNYADDLKEDLLSGALQVCSALQAAKVQTVSGVAAATLQQLVTTVFERVATEDARAKDIAPVAEIPGDDGPISIRPAAYDAYRIFRDLVLAVEDRKAKFVDLASLSKEASLELVFSCIDANPSLISKHAEFSSIVRSNVMPFVTRALSEKLSFPVTVRCMRVVDLVLTRHFTEFVAECEIALGLLAHGLEPDVSQNWKRSLFLEVLRNFFDDSNLVVTATMEFDSAGNGKPIVQDIMSAFVRLSTEKPAAIGLGQQSTIPTGPTSPRDETSEQLAFESAGGMAGVISSAFGVAEAGVPGISSQWSVPRSACLDQLDKSEPPAIPETYAYSLVLECLNSLSDNLAKSVLPFTVQHEKSKAKTTKNDKSQSNESTARTRTERSQSFRKRAVPLNPLDIEGPSQPRIKAVASLIESCWPAVLATSSTFLNAALDDQYYRSLIKAYQRFAQVAGLLRLSTPRDALMTTLGKAAVPPHVLSASTVEPVRSPSMESPRVFYNPRNLLSVDSLVSQTSTASTERDRRSSLEPSRPTLTIRNLLCLRALLNLAIALGPTLGPAFRVVIDVLKQADMVLSTAPPQQLTRQGPSAQSRDNESPSALHAFSSEVSAVEAAASRLLESTSDYPNDAFINILETFCRLLRGRLPTAALSPQLEKFSPPSTPVLERRKASGLPGLNTHAEMQSRDYQFIIPKLGNLAALNVSRFVTNEPEESGWVLLTEEVMKVAVSSDSPAVARRAATDLLCKLCAETIAQVSEEEPETRVIIQRRAFAVLLRVVEGIYAEDGELTNADVEVHGQVLDALQSILERSGESLVAGWNKILALISSVFDGDKDSTAETQDERTLVDWSKISHEFISIRLGREAFAAVQLICSDFLGLLPPAAVPALTELLYRFMGQKDDLNLSLTTITMTWNLADVLFDREHSSEIERLDMHTTDLPKLESQLQSSVSDSRAAQWLLVLVRLRDIVRSGQKESRKAAFQIICSICKNHGTQLSAGSWEILLQAVVFGIVSDHAAAITETSKVDPEEVQTAAEMTEIILEGTSSVVAQHIRIIEGISELSLLWNTFIASLESLLSNGNYATFAAIYRHLTAVFSTIEGAVKTWKAPVERTFAFWSSEIPPAPKQAAANQDNQAAFVAYTDLASELYRLLREDVTTKQTNVIVDNVFECVQKSHSSFYSGDVHTTSPLQGKSLVLWRSMRTDVPGAKSRLISTAAAAILLHTETTQDSKSGRPSFVALAGESIEWLQNLITTHAKHEELYQKNAILKGIESLKIVISRKYAMKLDYKGTMLWRRATTAAISIAKVVMSVTQSKDLSKETSTAMWSEYVQISGAIVKANGLHLYTDVQRIYDDQLSDIAAHEELRQILVPSLGGENLPDSIRASFAQSLFEASLIHQVDETEIPVSGEAALENIGTIRRGRVNTAFCQREQMSYVCFKDLITLSTLRANSTPEYERLSKAIAPLLILRLAIPIRAYIADQPLRGRAPQPLSELEELLFCFEQIEKLRLFPRALPQAGEDESGGEAGKAHLPFLYPLLAKAVKTAGDRWSGAEEVLAPLQGTLQRLSVF